MTTKTDTFMRSAGLIAALTLVSRLLGLVRDCVCAAVFGAGVTWDAFAFAFRVPNLFRRLFGEGALSAAFVPAFTESLELRGAEEASRLAGRVAGALAAALVMLLVAGEVLVLGLLWGLTLSLRWRLALALTAVMLPYMVLVCLAALAGAALQAMRHFAAPAAAPILLNLVWIAAVAAAAPAVSSDARGRIFVVAAGILVAGVLQLALQLAVLQRKGFRWHLSLHVLHPEVRRVAGAMAPVALGMAAFQINVLLDSLIAIALAGPAEGAVFHVMGRTVAYPMQAGANSVLYYASRLMQMPLGVFGIAVATAVFPTLSSHAARRNWKAFSDAVARSVGSMIFIGLPAGVGLILLRHPIIEVIFQRGAFTPAMTARTASVLLAYSTAVWAYCVLNVLTRAFYSLNRQGTAARVAACMVAANLALNLLLVWPLAEAGLAAATAITAVVQTGVLWWLLSRQAPLGGAGRRLLATLAKTALATAAMALGCWVGLKAAPDPAAGLGGKLLRLLLPSATGGLAFLAASAALGIEELRALLRQLLARGRAKRA